MFKKSLLAASLALVAINASAATTDNTVNTTKTEVFGKEFIATATTGIAIPSVTVTLGAQYSVGDIIRVSLSGATIDTTNTTAVATFATAATSAPTMTLGLLSTSATEAVFRVTVATGDHSDTIGGVSTIAVTGLKATTASAIAAGDISFVYSAETSTGIAIDVATTNTYKILKGVNQYGASFALSTDKFDAVVSTGSVRTAFTGPTYTDALTVAFPAVTIGATEIASATLFGAAPTASKVTVNGDFSFLDTSGDSKITAADDIFPAFANAGGTTLVTPAADLQSIVLTGPAAFSNAGVTVTAGNVAGETTIIDQSFSTDTELTYATISAASAKTTTTLAGGSWTLDGSSTSIAFLPFGTEYAQSITVTNTGSVAGAITIDITYAGNTFTKTLTAIADAKSVTDISAEVAAFAKASGVTGNARVNVTTNAPSIVVKGLYFHKPTQDRVLTQ